MIVNVNVIEIIRNLLCGKKDELELTIEKQKIALRDRLNEINSLKDSIIINKKELDKANLRYSEEVDKVMVLEDELKELKENIFKFEKLEEYADIWNDKHSQVTINYKGRTFPGTTKAMNVPLQLFITPHDPYIISDVDKYNLAVTDPTKCDDAIFNIYKFTRNNPRNPYRYAYDSASVGIAEFWMFPFELRYAGKGDCDDWGNELASYLIAAGVPNFRVRCAAGNCRGYNGGGHLTTYVLADDMKTWYHINSTTPPKMLKANKLSELPTSNDENDLIGLKTYWFSYNDQYAWSDFEGSKSDSDKLKKIIEIE